MKSETKEITYLTGQEIGGRITKDLSEFLKTHTTGIDRNDAAEKASISGETINAIVKRRRSLTENTYPGLVKLVKIAIDNCVKQGEQAKVAKNYMESLIES